MNAKEKEILIDQGRKIDKILEVLIGDEMGSFPGLIKQQKADEDFKIKTGKKLDDIIHNQQNQMRVNCEQLDINETVKKKLEEYDEFFLLFKKLSKVKKSTLIWLMSTLMLLGGIIYEIQHYIKTLTFKLPW